MELKAYLDERHGEGARLARALATPSSNLYAWANGTRPVPERHCAQIERATGGVVMRWDLRPSDWHLIWPELIGRHGAPAVPTAA